jgi:magnesium-transporting ATPase (P-type)
MSATPHAATKMSSPDMSGEAKHPSGMTPYIRFGLMIGVSTVIMFGLMYLNTYEIDHAEFSQTRAWMAIVMGATMAVVMLGFMWKMYGDIRVNLAIIAGSLAAFALALWLVRSQATVSDVSYMKAMIPHHSIAIMTSERAHIRDPRVRELADGIIEAQVREIAEMKQLIRDLEQQPTPEGSPDLPPRPATLTVRRQRL